MEAAFFDLDKTVIAKASMVAFGRPLYDAGMISRWLVVRAVWSNFIFHYMGADEERLRKVREKALHITRGWDQARVSAIVRETLIEVIEPIVYDEALDLIREHQEAGRRVFLISASPEEIVAPLAQYLGVDEAIASRARLDDEGRYTGEVEFYSYGPFKAAAMKELADKYDIDMAASFAYSDSITDLPMLEAVGHPVAVNPDRDLARIARERDWEISRFQHGVPLRKRVNVPARRVAAVMSGVAVGAGAVIAVWWWNQRRPLARSELRSPLPSHASNEVRRVGSRGQIDDCQARRGYLRPTRARILALPAVLGATRPGASSPRTRQGQGRRAVRGLSSWRAV